MNLINLNFFSIDVSDGFQMEHWQEIYFSLIHISIQGYLLNTFIVLSFQIYALPTLNFFFLVHLTLCSSAILIVCIYEEGGGGDWYCYFSLLWVLITSHFIFYLHFHVFPPPHFQRREGEREREQREKAFNILLKKLWNDTISVTSLSPFKL